MEIDSLRAMGGQLSEQSIWFEDLADYVDICMNYTNMAD